MNNLLRHGFALGHIRMLTSHHIWLALDDNEHENHRTYPEELELGEFISLRLCEHFQKQLFYWLLIRGKPGIFSDSQLAHTVPHHLLCQN